jgi:hypothetical protein
MVASVKQHSSLRQSSKLPELNWQPSILSALLSWAGSAVQALVF